MIGVWRQKMPDCNWISGFQLEDGADSAHPGSDLTVVDKAICVSSDKDSMTYPGDASSLVCVLLHNLKINKSMLVTCQAVSNTTGHQPD
jgi:hypothetical protein